MGVLIDGKWTRRRAAAGDRRDRPVQARRQRLPRPHHRRRLVRLQGRARPLSSLCRARLPVGASHADLSRTEEARWADFGRLFDPGPEDSTAGPSSDDPALPGLHPRQGQRLPLPARGLYREQSDLHRQGHGADAVGQEDQEDRQQRVVRDHPDAQHRVQRHHRRPRPTIIRRRCAPRSTRSTSASITTSTTACIAAGFAKSQAAYEEAYDGLFATLDWLEERLSRAALSGRQPDHRGRLAAVSDAGALRRRLFLDLQVQQEAHRRLSEPVELHARALPGARRRRHGDAALLRHQLLFDSEGEPDR